MNYTKKNCFKLIYILYILKEMENFQIVMNIKNITKSKKNYLTTKIKITQHIQVNIVQLLLQQHFIQH